MINTEDAGVGNGVAGDSLHKCARNAKSGPDGQGDSSAGEAFGNGQRGDAVWRLGGRMGGAWERHAGGAESVKDFRQGDDAGTEGHGACRSGPGHHEGNQDRYEKTLDSHRR